MKIYADHPARLCAQVLADLFAAAWIATWIWAAGAVHGAISALARPGKLIADAGDGVDEHMADAADKVRQVPLAGDGLAAPFGSIGDAGASLGDAGRGLQETVADMALALSLITAVLPVLFVVLTWLPARARWVRRANGALRLRAMGGEAGARLLALRALTSASPARLAAVHADPVGAWHADDTAAVHELAAVELRRLGLRSWTLPGKA
ncbi:MAG: hypothetical protein M0026_01745 [Nocardiopsaceae bacterium]|nr:hypothetical protein [Nocardiopsaceae bacterium]